MKKAFRVAIIAFGILLSAGLLQSCSKDNDDDDNPSQDRAAIEALITAYQDALNASDADKVVALYTAAGVLMPSNAPTAEGTDAVKGTYQYVFANFQYTLRFTVLEVVITGNHAFVRSTSKGTYVVKASGQTVADEYRELFVFEKAAGGWKIARYMYNQPR